MQWSRHVRAIIPRRARESLSLGVTKKNLKKRTKCEAREMMGRHVHPVPQWHPETFSGRVNWLCTRETSGHFYAWNSCTALVPPPRLNPPYEHRIIEMWKTFNVQEVYEKSRWCFRAFGPYQACTAPDTADKYLPINPGADNISWKCKVALHLPHFSSFLYHFFLTYFVKFIFILSILSPSPFYLFFHPATRQHKFIGLNSTVSSKNTTKVTKWNIKYV